jgi:non-ribosomal peptide synthetase component F
MEHRSVAGKLHWLSKYLGLVVSDIVSQTALLGSEICVFEVFLSLISGAIVCFPEDETYRGLISCGVSVLVTCPPIPLATDLLQVATLRQIVIFGEDASTLVYKYISSSLLTFVY